MPFDVTTSVTVSGPSVIQSSSSYTSGAVDSLSIELQPNTTDEEVLVQPSPASAVQLLALQAETGDDSVTYKMSPAGPPIVLRGAHVYAGPSWSPCLVQRQRPSTFRAPTKALFS